MKPQTGTDPFGDDAWADPAVQVDSATRTCCRGIGGHTRDCSESTELINGPNGRWLGYTPDTRGIYRHVVPDIGDIDVRDYQDGIAWHTISTAIADWAGVTGELVRWVAEDEHGYEVRINGIEDNAGISDLAAYSRNSLAAIAKVANDLRYEWDRIAEGEWSVW